MRDETGSNIPTMDVESLVKQISEAYCTVIEKGLPIRTIPSVMLWGPPGVGKSQAVQQIAGEIQKRTGKNVQVTDVRLILFSPIDLRGIPTSNADKTLAVWLKPKIFQMDESEDVVNVLFLDEISAAPQSVQACAYQITLDRVIGEHKLPENCIVIGAGNRITDKSVAFKMPKALPNRLMHFEVEDSFSSWKKWAVRAGINSKVLGFLSFQPSYLMAGDAHRDNLAFATPRTWEMVSNVLNAIGDDVEQVYDLVAGLVGTAMAIEFRTWSKVYRELPDIKDIFDGGMPPLPGNTDALYALTAAMTEYARRHREEVKRIANSIRYAQRMPADFAAVLMKNYMYLHDGYREKLIHIPEFRRWLETKGGLIRGTVP